MRRTLMLAAAVGMVTRVALGDLQTSPLSLDPSAGAAPAAMPVTLLDEERFAPDDVHITLYWENDGNWAKPFDQHDRHYTAGAGASVAWRALWVDRLLAPVPATGLGIGGTMDYALGLAGNLTMYTPENITSPVPQRGDRPFAGYTYGGLFAQRAHRVAAPEFGFPGPAMLGDPGMYSAFEALELDVGMLGPSSLGENAQSLIHHMIGLPYPQGWINQIHDEPEFSLKYVRRWRSVAARPVEQIPVAIQVIPEAAATVGSLQDELRAGVFFRLGYNLPDDFGPGELGTPADATGQAPCTCPGIFDNILTNQSLYVFARPYGSFVAHNALLQGDNWRHDDVVTANPEPAIFAMQGGIAWRIFKHFELAYMTTYESPEFTGQKGWDSWSSVQVTFSMSW